MKQLPGYYSVEQVINIINDIEDDGGKLNEDSLQKLKALIVEKVEDYICNLDGDDVVDYGSAELELNGNEISVTGISVEADGIIDKVKDGIDEAFEDFDEANCLA